MKLGLILCAFGIHKWYYRCATSSSGRNTARECGRCPEYEEGRWIEDAMTGQHGFFLRHRKQRWES